MKRIVSFIVVFTLVMGGMTHVQAQSKAVEKAEKKLEREAKKEAREAKDAIMAAADTDSVVTGFTTGDSVRGLKNRFSDRYLKAEYSGASPDELSSISAGTTKRGALFGDTENGFILAGMSLTHLTKIQSAKEIVEELVSETERRLAAAPGLI